MQLIDAIKEANDVFGLNYGIEHVIADWQPHQLKTLRLDQLATLKKVCEDCIENKKNERQKDMIRAKRTLDRINMLSLLESKE